MSVAANLLVLLIAWEIVTLMLFLLINPDYMGLLFTTTAGQVMLALAVGLEFLGAMSIKKVLAIEI